MLRRVRAGFAAEKGAAMVELAISIVVLATLLMGVIEFGRVMQAQVVLNNGARVGTRYGSQGVAVSDGTIRATVKTATSDVIDIADGDITILRELGPGGVPAVIVTIEHELTLVPLIGMILPENPVTLQATTSMRLET